MANHTIFQVNRFNMPLLNVTGKDCVEKNWHVGFGLSSGEAQGDFEFHLMCIKTLCDKYNISYPKVALTDFDKALKNAITAKFPGAKQQLCRWHVLKNIAKHIKMKWESTNEERNVELLNENTRNCESTRNRDRNDTGMLVDDTEDPADEAASAEATQLLQNNTGVPARPESLGARVFEDSREGFIFAVKASIYASTEEKYNNLWLGIKEEFKRQKRKSLSSFILISFG